MSLKRLALLSGLLAASVASNAQTITVGSTSVAAGGTASIPVTFTAAAAPGAVNSFQVNLTFTRNPPVVASGLVTGVAGTVTLANSIACGGNATTNVTGTTIIIGAADLAGTPDAIGTIGTAETVCTFSFPIPAGTTPGNYPFVVALSEFTNPAGVKIPGTVTAPIGSITVTMGGVNSNVTLGPAAGLAFGNSNVGTPTAVQNLTLQNTNAMAGSVTTCTISGAGAANFQFFPALAGAITVASGATVNVPVRFNPTAAGALAAVVNCTAGAATTITGMNIPLAGTGVAVDAAPTLTYAPAPLAAVNFPAGAAGAATTTIAITSAGAAGTGNTVLSACTIGAGFTPAGTVTTTPANGTFTTAVTSGSINLGCTRGATVQNATLTCTETRTPTVAGSPFTRTWPLTCPVATLPAAVLTPSIASGGSTAALNVTVGSTGSTTVNFANAAGGQAGGPITCTIAAPANGWTAGAATGSIAAGASAGVTFSFAPTATGAGNAVASCTGTGLAAGYTVNLLGNGVAPVVNLVTQVPSLSDIGKWLLIASLLGFGLVVVGRRQS